MNFYFQPRNFRHTTIEADGCAEKTVRGPVTKYGIGLSIAVGLGVAGAVGGTVAGGIAAGVGTAAAITGIGSAAYNLSQGSPNLGTPGYRDASAVQTYAVEQDQRYIDATRGFNSEGPAAVAYFKNNGTNYAGFQPAIVPKPAASQSASPDPTQAPVTGSSSPSDLEYVALGLGILAIGAALFLRHKK